MAIQMRRGALDKLDRSKLLPGEFAICEDGTVVICYATGKTKVVTSLELENARVSADGTVYETLKERLDQEYNQLTKELENDISQLSEEIDDLKQNGTGTGGTGISTTAKDLMITLFRKALYNENVSGLIDSLDEALSGGSVDVPDDGGEDTPDTPTITDDITVSDGVMTILSVGSDITVSDGVMTIA